MKSCKLCRYCYCPDEEYVEGLFCEKNSIIKIIDSDKIHELCPGFKLSLLKLLFKL